MKVALEAVWVSLIRTIVPNVVGAVLSLFAVWSIVPDSELKPTLTVLVTVVLQSLYYTAVRLFERFVSPRFGWLLGSTAQPVLFVKPEPGKTPVVTVTGPESPGVERVVVVQEPTRDVVG